jgi:hypothetical protein
LFKDKKLLPVFVRYVHISKATLLCLGDDYKTIPGNGGERDAYLKKHNVMTYLIDASQVRTGTKP